MGSSDGNYDLLSPAAQRCLAPDGLYRRLVVTGDGEPINEAVLRTLTAENVLSVPIVDPDEAAGVVAGLWLLNDWLERSHTISQSIESSTGSFWHAIMHRREGDFNNAKYWYGKCRNHPSMTEMARRGSEVVAASSASNEARAVVGRGWDAYALVDFIESFYDAADDHPPLKLAQDLQRLEWDILFDHTLRCAAGRA
jgi:hypothetical protein